MAFDLQIHSKAQKQLISLNKNNPKAFKKVNFQILKLSENLHLSNLWIKKLTGKYAKYFCIKTGKYRIKFGFENNVITIYEIDDRKDAYR
ncbi:hypothetical protein KAU19_05535 [Candidatus Parcubacteria bacterium]|nr:hypothetical protein [Candidatus Parcubacteria bacterium]